MAVPWLTPQLDDRPRRADGEDRWILDRGVPHDQPGGRFGGYIGSCIDVTDRRRLEQARLQRVEDRERIARELHETLVKRLFSIGLSLQADPPRRPRLTRPRRPTGRTVPAASRRGPFVTPPTATTSIAAGRAGPARRRDDVTAMPR